MRQQKEAEQQRQAAGMLAALIGWQVWAIRRASRQTVPDPLQVFVYDFFQAAWGASLVFMHSLEG